MYVDGIVITWNHEPSITNLKEFLNTKITIKYLGTLKYFLGVEFARSKDGICLNERKYELEHISDARLSGSKLCDLQWKKNMRLTSKEFYDSAGIHNLR